LSYYIADRLSYYIVGRLDYYIFYFYYIATHASMKENVLMMLIYTHVTVPVVGMEFSVNTILMSVPGLLCNILFLKLEVVL